MGGEMWILDFHTGEAVRPATEAERRAFALCAGVGRQVARGSTRSYIIVEDGTDEGRAVLVGPAGEES